MTRNEHCNDIELLLSSFECLKRKIELDKQDIDDLIKEGKSIEANHRLINPNEWNPDIDDEIRHKQRIRRRERSMLNTERLVKKVERIIKEVENDKYYYVIQMHYFEEKGLPEIACDMQVSIRTLINERTRLLNKLSIFVYGARALVGGE